MKRGGGDAIHVDVMDGHFVPNLSMGPHVVSCLRKATRLPLDVHLMVDNPARMVEPFLDAGASGLTVHVETKGNIRGILRRIRSAGASPALCLKPATPVSALRGLYGLVDMVLVMTVEPGYGGQHFIRKMLGKISALRSLAVRAGRRLHIEVDGGINASTAAACARAGANVLVAGVAVFGARNPAVAIRRIRAAAESGLRRWRAGS